MLLFLFQVLAKLIPVLENCGEFSESEVVTVKSVFEQDIRKMNVDETWSTIIHYDSWVVY